MSFGPTARCFFCARFHYVEKLGSHEPICSMRPRRLTVRRAVSMAAARLASAAGGEPLYKRLRRRAKYRLPVPMMNIINGGKHAGNRLAIQEFLIEPVAAKSMNEAVRFGSEVYHALRSTLKGRFGTS
ncbi:MAG: hypothetical protein JRN11_01410 [Nitrososphaerota archaeon]|nr:hypothetical protein [Nitrososphaerota archaeon]MDG7025389.1 hypothetical protein [Nitrososphaerota archaeon]